MTVDLDKLQALADAASRGPWKSCKSPTEGFYVELPGVDHSGLAVYSNVGVWTDKGVTSEANANFIAACREAVPELIAEVRRLRASLTQLETINATGTASDSPSTKEKP